jgi:hypothetical protein
MRFTMTGRCLAPDTVIQEVTPMLLILQVVTVFLVAVAMSLTLAHALELPGKMRLDREAYLTTQPIYYPGFTIGAGVGEAGGIMATVILLLLTPRPSAEFNWILIALAFLAAMHAVYWVLTHPVNKVWLKGADLKGLSSEFFGFDPLKRSGSTAGPDDDWRRLRDRWEHSHVIRAVLASAGLVCLVIAVAI